MSYSNSIIHLKCMDTIGFLEEILVHLNDIVASLDSGKQQPK